MHDLRPDALDAPPYVVTCIEADRSAGVGHEHVVAIETQDPDGGQTRWSTAQVLAAVREGEHFLTADGRTSLELAACPRCATVTLAVSPLGPDIAPCR
jgi:hypothetical protein